MKFVNIESPYMAPTLEEVKRNIRYARACARDSLSKGEIPYASHLFFTQAGILDDNVAKEREKRIRAGRDIIDKLCADTAVYTDLGISNGMKWGIKKAEELGRSVEYRSLGEKWEKEFLGIEGKHSQRKVW